MQHASRVTPDDRASLPLISVEDLRCGTETDGERVAHEIGKAAREYGFFRICDHGIDLSLIESVYKTAARFFARPDTFKQAYYIGESANHRGYVPFNEKGDYPDEKHRNYEAFDLGLDLPRDDPDFLAGNRVLGPNVWPDMTGFQEIVGTYYTQVSALGRLICSALEMHLGLPAGAMTDHMSKPISQLRLLHYVRDANTSVRESVNMGAHTDYECLTLLHTRNAGLQVLAPDDTWIDVPVDPKALVVNIGDMLEAWSNGILRSTPHRVLNLSDERFSLPYFVATDHGTVIAPFPQLLEEGKPSKYHPFLAGEHLERMLMRDFPYLRRKQLVARSGDGVVDGGPIQNPFEDRLSGKAS